MHRCPTEWQTIPIRCLLPRLPTPAADEKGPRFGVDTERPNPNRSTPPTLPRPGSLPDDFPLRRRTSAAWNEPPGTAPNGRSRPIGSPEPASPPDRRAPARCRGPAVWRSWRRVHRRYGVSPGCQRCVGGQHHRPNRSKGTPQRWPHRARPPRSAPPGTTTKPGPKAGRSIPFPAAAPAWPPPSPMRTPAELYPTPHWSRARCYSTI